MVTLKQFKDLFYEGGLKLVNIHDESIDLLA